MIWKKKQLWGTLIAIVLLAICVKDVKLEDVRMLSERVRLVYLIPAVLCTFAFVIAKALRWKLMAAQQKQIRPWRAITLYSTGQVLNIVMPALTGQVGRLFLFARTEGLRKTFIFSTIVLEVLFDSISLIAFLMLTSLAFVFPPEYRSISYVIAGITAAVLVLLYLIMHFQNSLEEFGRVRLRDRWPGVYVGMRKFIRSFVQGINLLRSSQHTIGSLIYSLFSWITHTLVIYFLLKSFGFELPIAASASVMIINTLALMIPITPGNAGTFEVAVSTSLAAFSVGRTDAVLFALALHLLDLLPIAILSFVFLHQEKVSIRQLKSEHEDEIIFDKMSEEGTLVENEEHL